MFNNVEVYENENEGLTAFYLDEIKGIVGMSVYGRDGIGVYELVQEYVAVAVAGVNPCEWKKIYSIDEMSREYDEGTIGYGPIAAAGIGEYYGLAKSQRGALGVRCDECSTTAGMLFVRALLDDDGECV